MLQTKKILAESLKDMLKTKSLEKITVRELVERCNINRQTFYYHFHDIYELLEYMFFVELDKIFYNPTKSDIPQFSERWEKIYYAILCSFLKEKRIIISVFHSIGKRQLQNILNNVFHYVIIKILEEESKGLLIDEEEKLFIADFYKYSFVGVTLDWVNSFMKINPEIIVRRMSNLIGGDIRKGLEKNYKSMEL